MSEDATIARLVVAADAHDLTSENTQSPLR